MAVKEKVAQSKVSAEQAADFLNEMAGQGTENISAGDTSRNYLKICQPTSSELSSNDPIEGLKPGEFFSSTLKKRYGKNIEVIILRYEIKWNIWQAGRGSLVRVVPVNGCQMIKDDQGRMHDYEGNDIVETQNFYVLLPDYLEDGIMIFSLTSTGLKHGRKWNSKILATKTPNGTGVAPIFGSVWRIAALQNKNKKGAWYTIGDEATTAVEFSRYISGEEWKSTIKDSVEMIRLMVESQQAALAGPAAQGAIEDKSEGEDTLAGV